MPLAVNGWWRAHVVVTRQGSQPVAADFSLLLPDPSFAGAERGRPTDGAAAQWFDAAMARLGEIRTLRSEENLTDGVGNSVRTRYGYQAPDRFAYATTSGSSSVAIGPDQYFREPDGAWVRQTRVSPVRYPADVQGYYTGATELTLGRQEQVDGERCQIVSFLVPAAPGRDDAWYVWWVGTTSHLIRRESMAATHHYMTTAFSDPDAPMSIAVPESSPSTGSAPGPASTRD